MPNHVTCQLGMAISQSALTAVVVLLLEEPPSDVQILLNALI